MGFLRLADVLVFVLFVFSYVETVSANEVLAGTAIILEFFGVCRALLLLCCHFSIPTNVSLKSLKVDNFVILEPFEIRVYLFTLLANVATLSAESLGICWGVGTLIAHNCPQLGLVGCHVNVL
jgi:hypothetical protein